MASCIDSIQPPSMDVHEARLLHSAIDNSWKKSSGNDIDVYLKPLVHELTELWTEGMQVYDAVDKSFYLYASEASKNFTWKWLKFWCPILDR